MPPILARFYISIWQDSVSRWKFSAIRLRWPAALCLSVRPPVRLQADWPASFWSVCSYVQPSAPSSRRSACTATLRPGLRRSSSCTLAPRTASGHASIAHPASRIPHSASDIAHRSSRIPASDVQRVERSQHLQQGDKTPDLTRLGLIDARQLVIACACRQRASAPAAPSRCGAARAQHCCAPERDA